MKTVVSSGLITLLITALKKGEHGNIKRNAYKKIEIFCNDYFTLESNVT